LGSINEKIRVSCDAVRATTALATCGNRGWKYRGAVVVNDNLQSGERERGRVLGDLKQGEGGFNGLCLSPSLFHSPSLSSISVILYISLI
jgi:hypothetical protein